VKPGKFYFCKFLKPCPGLEKVKKKNRVRSFKTVSYPAVIIKTRDPPNTGNHLEILEAVFYLAFIFTC
jgi:hypothetical protein